MECLFKGVEDPEALAGDIVRDANPSPVDPPPVPAEGNTVKVATARNIYAMAVTKEEKATFWEFLSEVMSAQVIARNPGAYFTGQSAGLSAIVRSVPIQPVEVVQLPELRFISMSYSGSKLDAAIHLRQTATKLYRIAHELARQATKLEE